MALLARAFRDLDLAEDAAQEAFAIAADRWPRAGVPDSPAAWLTTTARNRAIDDLRRRRTLGKKLPLLELADLPAMARDDGEIPDERLELLFTCCHPALPVEARVALTLRAVGGLSCDEIARAFLVTGETMKRRLSRARRKVRASGISFDVPEATDLPDRLAGVLAVIYLIFNDGYSDPGRMDPAAEAIRLGRMLTELVPAEPEVHGLVALMLLHHARRAARVRDGEVVTLPEQDPALWDEHMLAEGLAVLERAIRLGGRGSYTLQATIAAAQSSRPIDWPGIAALYRRLHEQTDSPVVVLNGAVAIAETEGPAAALAVVDALPLDGYRYFHATRAELLRRVDDRTAARAEYRRAIALAATEPERRCLQRRLGEL